MGYDVEDVASILIPFSGHVQMSAVVDNRAFANAYAFGHKFVIALPSGARATVFAEDRGKGVAGMTAIPQKIIAFSYLPQYPATAFKQALQPLYAPSHTSVA